MKHIFVPGIPAPQGSKRHVGNGRMIESSKRLPAWRKTVTEAVVAAGWHREPLLTEPLWLELLFYLPRPQRHFGTGRNAGVVKPGASALRPTSKPDLDKLTRAVMDALTEAGAWRDDSQVIDLLASKVYADVDDHPGVLIILREAI